MYFIVIRYWYRDQFRGYIGYPIRSVPKLDHCLGLQVFCALWEDLSDVEDTSTPRTRTGHALADSWRVPRWKWHLSMVVSNVM